MVRKRTLIERAEAIFNFINNQKKPFTKSKLMSIGINTVNAEKWLDLIVFIQNQPKIRLIKTGNSVVIETIPLFGFGSTLTMEMPDPIAELPSWPSDSYRFSTVDSQGRLLCKCPECGKEFTKKANKK